MPRVFVTGGSGFVGSAVIAELLARQFPVHALVNRRELGGFADQVQIFRGTVFDDSILNAAMRGCDAVIHLVGIIMEKPSKGATFERVHFEGTRHVVDAAVRNGVRRYLQMSALGSRIDAVSDYHKTKYQAEEYLRASNLEWTIFRPSIIHGLRGEFMQTEAKWARKQAPPFLFMPYFGAGLMGRGGAGMLQPIFVEDVARAFADALETDRTTGEVYPLGGADKITWPQLHRIASKAIVGHERAVLAMPVWEAKLLAAIGVAHLAGFNGDQIIMSQEDNTCDMTKFEHDFGWKTRGFEETLKEYAEKL